MAFVCIVNIPAGLSHASLSEPMVFACVKCCFQIQGGQNWNHNLYTHFIYDTLSPRLGTTHIISTLVWAMSTSVQLKPHARARKLTHTHTHLSDNAWALNSRVTEADRCNRHLVLWLKSSHLKEQSNILGTTVHFFIRKCQTVVWLNYLNSLFICQLFLSYHGDG